jgi:penicillin-binding protein 1A
MNKRKITLNKSPKKRTATKPQSRLDIVRENRLKRILSSRKLKKRSSNKRLKKKLSQIGLVSLGVGLVALVIGGIVGFSYIHKLNKELPSPDDIWKDPPNATEIFDRTGETRLYRLIDKDYNSDPVNIENIPEAVKWTFLAAEDIEFYNHQGFDVIAIARCAYKNMRDSSSTCGGSTITQQLLKITSLGNEVKIERKIKEVLLSIKAEQKYSKDEILGMYLRVVPMGSNMYGVETGSRFYFGKDTKDLTLAEAAVVAGVVINPTYWSPTLSIDKENYVCRLKDGLIIESADPETMTFDEKGYGKLENGDEVVKAQRWKCRQLYILGQMEHYIEKINDQTRSNYNDPDKEDVLTLEMIQEAKKQELTFKPPVFTDMKAGHFVNYVISELQKRNYKNGEEPFTLSELQTAGYKVITTLDYGLQQVAERYVASAGNDYSYWNMHNAAVMTMIPSSGQIITMAGSKNFYGDSEGCDANGENCWFNGEVNVLTSLQSPGSTNKPLGYYLAYKEGKVFTGSLLPDVPIVINDASGVYEPRNWDDGFNGVQYSVAQALRDSRNLPAIEIVQMAGVDNYVKTAEQFGYTSYTENYGQSVILGGASVYPLEHAQAYGVFANGGDFVQLDPILKILDKDGNVVYEPKPERKPIADQQAVYLLNQTLMRLDVYGYQISWDGREVSGKTGTTQDNKDSWFVGYSPDFVSLAWGGNNNNDPLDAYHGYPPYVIMPWWTAYMREIGGASYFTPQTPFNRPAYVYQGGGDCNAEGQCLGISGGWLIEGRTPPRDIIKTKVKICKDQRDRLARPIDEQLGFAEEAEFVQYRMPVPEWQGFLDNYMASKGMRNGPPTESCTIDRTGGVQGPYFNWGAPNAGDVLSNKVNVRGSVYTTSGNITSLEFFIDGQSIGGSNKFAPFDVTLNVPNLENGEYAFKAVATDSTGKSNVKEFRVFVGSDTNSKISFVNPAANQNYTVESGNIPIRISTVGLSGLSEVTLYQIRNGGAAQVVGAMNNVPGGYSLGWSTDQAGSYTFFVTARLGATGILKSPISPTITAVK